MSEVASAEWYRSQAEKFLQRAEAAERLSRLGDLPVGSVIRWTTVDGQYTWVALAVDRDDTRYWYLTSQGKNQMLTTNILLDQLISLGVEEVQVATDWATLSTVLNIVVNPRTELEK